MKQTRILIVDDEAGLTRLLKLNLEETGKYAVEAINDSRKALAAAERFKPDLVLLDVMMPSMDGGEAAVRLKDHPVLHSVPVIFLTAAAKPDEVKEGGGQIGGCAMIAKPVDLPQLIQRIEEELSKHARATAAAGVEGHR